MNELIAKVKELAAELVADAELQAEKGNKAAGTRARKASLTLEKVLKEFRKVSLEELSAYPWISLTSEALTRKFLNDYFAEHGLQFSPDMELATTDLILPAVRHNLGIGFVPEEFAEEEKRAGNVFEIEVEEKLPTRNIILIYDTEYPQSIASKEFQKFLSSQN